MKKHLVTIFSLAVIAITGLYLYRHSAELSKINLQPSIPANQTVELTDYGPAPEFAGVTAWLNSDSLTIAGLKGKVVLIDFWTYSCINCIRTFPYVTKWYETYKDKGLVIVGVHTPEFPFEKEISNVADAIKRFKITYPVVLDNDYAVWNDYQNRYWPAEYLIDQKGEVVYAHFGEGNYDHTENAIRSLLGLKTEKIIDTGSDLSGVESPEMYLGTARLEYLAPGQTESPEAKNYTLPSDLDLNNFALEGKWQFTPQSTKLAGPSGKIKLKFHSGKVHVVAQSPNVQALSITVDGKQQPDVKVQQSELYTLFDSNDYADHVIEINIPQSGFEAFAFTFG
ncbi:MAG TPA: thioredoxin family protein [Patescibacteria group bacterium]|jgi:thiol-disulfide isomerase/thioredoxin|nr:thioredoxin family protein [Patescibacteria group bacterium]